MIVKTLNEKDELLEEWREVDKAKIFTNNLPRLGRGGVAINDNCSVAHKLRSSTVEKITATTKGKTSKRGEEFCDIIVWQIVCNNHVAIHRLVH